MNNTLREAVFFTAVFAGRTKEDACADTAPGPAEEAASGMIVINCGPFSVRVSDGALVHGDRCGIGGGQINL